MDKTGVDDMVVAAAADDVEEKEKESKDGDAVADDVEIEAPSPLKKKSAAHLTYACSQTYWGVPASCGKTAESLRFLGGFKYDVAALYQIMRGDIRKVKLTMYFDETESNTYSLTIDLSVLVVMKNKYFGKGLMITPLA